MNFELNLRPTPMKLAVLVWTIILWLCLLSPGELSGIMSSVQWGIPPSFSFSNVTLVPALKLFVAALFSGVANILLMQHINIVCDFKGRKEEREEYLRSVEKERFIKLMDEKAGISKVYVSDPGTSAQQCAYYDDIMKHVVNSRSLRILSIAGYEAVGRGPGKSLFHDEIVRRSGLSTEVIISSPENSELIRERIRQIQQSNQNYTEKKLVEEIDKTVGRIKKLKEAREEQGGLAELSLSFFKWHPVFRLIILDDCVFMNTYEGECHGHESPMYRIDKADKNVPGRLSLYDSYVTYFENVKANSTAAFS